jgi:adenylosuccinate lyase
MRGDRRGEERRRSGSENHQLLMISRYTRPEIGAVWTPRRKMECWLEVELAATEAWAEEGGVPGEAAEAIRGATFTVEAVQDRERLTDHDVAAFVDVVAQSVGEHGRWVHYGLTSSDVLDTALALQLRQAGEIVLASASAYREALIERALEHRDTLCVGRTHGVHAEPTSFGLRLAGFAFEADRNLTRLADAFDQLAFGKLSGAVGTYASAPPAVEARVMERLRLRREDVATQVVPRDRHAVLTSRIAIAGGGLERFATEVRNLQRTEVREVEEPFGVGQKGSSAMPHKRNPIRTERITGLSRVLRGYAQTGLENIALWHERDISHSGAERVIIPDATIALDYMQDLAAKVAAGMSVRADRMRENLELTHGALFSQRALSALVESGMARDDAYRVVQESAQRAWDTGAEFRDLLADAAPDLDLDAVFDYGAYLTHLPEVFERLEALRD